MNAIPLINNIPKTNINNEKQLRQEINTSLVALKKEAGTLEGLINEAAQMLVTINNRIATLENDTVKKSDIVDVVQSGNLQPVTSNAVADKISSLDVSSVGGSGKYISAISETDGKINATATDLATSVASGNSNPITSDAVFQSINSLTYIKNLTNTGYTSFLQIPSGVYAISSAIYANYTDKPSDLSGRIIFIAGATYTGSDEQVCLLASARGGHLYLGHCYGGTPRYEWTQII